MLASASELAAMLLHQTGNVKMLIIMTTARLSPPAERLLILAKMQRLTGEEEKVAQAFTFTGHNLGSPIDSSKNLYQLSITS